MGKFFFQFCFQQETKAAWFLVFKEMYLNIHTFVYNFGLLIFMKNSRRSSKVLLLLGSVCHCTYFLLNYFVIELSFNQQMLFTKWTHKTKHFIIFKLFFNPVFGSGQYVWWLFNLFEPGRSYLTFKNITFHALKTNCNIITLIAGKCILKINSKFMFTVILLYSSCA